MAKLFNLARMTTATTGTGTITLGAAVSGCLSFAQAGVSNDDVVSYAIKDGNDSEIGTGTYSSSGTTLTRNSVNSTNGNAAINLSGAAEVFITPRAEDLILPRNYIDGLILSTPGTSPILSATAGIATDSTNTEMMALPAALSKTIGSWTVGGGGGLLDTGSSALNTWYHVYLIKRPDTGVVDFCTSLSATAPTFGVNIPSAYTRYRRIGSARTQPGSASQWIKFIQDGDEFMWNFPQGDVNAGNPGTAAILRTLSVPTGVRVKVKMVASLDASPASATPVTAYINDPNLAANASFFGSTVSLGLYVSSVTTGEVLVSGYVESWTNTSAQVRTILQLSGVGTLFTISTLGWVDRRGRDA